MPGASYSLEGDPATVLPTLRAWLREQLVTLSEDAVAVVALVGTELASNALEHAQPPRSLRVSQDTTVLLEVDDGGPAERPSPGYGLMIVDRLSHWGVRMRETGKTVWAHIPVDQA
ncbi:ATP-binding protein [Actinokineospora sp. NBRC 105648]|uniref:ATP-binding protein n=1 Tax=Actinokineospora sp. NBRC 105648 TaxID=3032206 RepID=UPI0024A4A406|nr:ATP-binding protein [Actinokineospora sp. NBRC 105648]GLZ41976.1 histidine kinase [Actinokineospora sp. NBRC 105648]